MLRISSNLPATSFAAGSLRAVRLNPLMVFIAVLAAGVLLGLLAREAYAAAYLGSGYFTQCDNGATCRISRTDGLPSSYNTAVGNAYSRWNNETQLNLLRDDSYWRVYTSVYNAGGTGYNGWAIIDSAGGQCSPPWNGGCTSAVVNNPYNTCVAYINRFYVDSFSPAEKENVTMHELGHCWSLAHSSEAGSIMRTGKSSDTTLSSGDKTNINNRY